MYNEKPNIGLPLWEWFGEGGLGRCYGGIYVHRLVDNGSGWKPRK
jgi:hypothetical protein